MTLISLSEPLRDHVLKFVGHDRPRLLALSHTCKVIRVQVMDNERYHRLAFYICCNYAIVATNMDKIHLWHSLKYCNLLSLGEKHNSYYDRFRNATCIHLFWKEGKTSLFLETPPTPGEGQLSCVNKEIAVQGRSWDLPESIKWITYIADGLTRFTILNQVRQYLLLCNEVPKIDADNVERTFFCLKAQAYHETLLLDEKKLPLADISLPDFRSKLLWKADCCVALQDSGEKLLVKVTEIGKALKEVFESELEIRDQFLCQRVKEKTQLNQVVTLSGAYHNEENSELVKAAKKNGTPFISVISFDTLRYMRERELKKTTTFSDLNLLVLLKMREAVINNEKIELGYDTLQVLEFVLQNEINGHRTYIKTIHSLLPPAPVTYFQDTSNQDIDLYGMIEPPD